MRLISGRIADMGKVWNVFLVFVAIDTCCSVEAESRARTYKSAKDFSLVGHVINTRLVQSEMQCGVQCSRHDSCQSYNYEHVGDNSGRLCELNGQTRESMTQDYLEKPGFTYYGQVELICVLGRCLHGATCITLATEEQYQCLCDVGYTGRHCETVKVGWFSAHPGQSCKHILTSGDSKGDGPYWLDPGNNGNPFKAYCDMSAEGGGWLLVANFVMNSSASPPEWTAGTTYRAISYYNNNRTGITDKALGQLGKVMPFTQLRFYCRKARGNTFHVITAKNKSGHAVVRYFSGETDTLPVSCGSYVRASDDNSSLATRCARWGNDNGHYVGKWGHYKIQDLRMYSHAAFEAFKYHWSTVKGSWLCDDNPTNNYFNLSSGDFWKVYVR